MKELKIGNLLTKVPIVQGGMGVGISLSGLTSAVANAGGIGVISSAGLGVIYNEFSKDFNQACIYGLKEELRKAKEKTKGIIGINIMVALTNFADLVKTAIAEKADIIFAGRCYNNSEPCWHARQSNPQRVPRRREGGSKKPKACSFNCIKTCDVTNSPYCIMLALYNAYKGRMDHGYAFAGSNAWRCDKILKVSELFDELKAGYNAKLTSL